MTTVNTLLKGALRVSTVIGRGFTPSSEDINDALEACNQMLSSWSSSEVVVPYRTRESFTPASSKASYTIGSGGDFNTTRPISIEAITVTADGTDHPLGKFDLKQYNALAVKTQVGIPDNFYYEPTYPTGTIYFDYEPTTAYTVTIDSIKPLTAFASLGTTVTLPDGYEEAIKYNLAMRICTEYGRPIPQGIAVLAQEAYDKIYGQSLSQRMTKQRVDPVFLPQGAGYNILRDG